MTDVLQMVLACVAILFSGVTSVFSILAFAKVVGMEKSTHKIEYMAAPLPDIGAGEAPNPTGKELAKKFMPSEEW